jgi:hypothetical protein
MFLSFTLRYKTVESNLKQCKSSKIAAKAPDPIYESVVEMMNR